MRKKRNPKLKTKVIWGVKCPACLKRMFSFHVHDYKLCGCGNETMVDGGRQYLRFGWAILKPSRIKWTEKLDGKYPTPSMENKDTWPY